MDAIVSLVTLLLVFGAGGRMGAHPAAAVDAVMTKTMAPTDYWHAVLPETPMPQAVYDILTQQSTVHASRDEKSVVQEDKDPREVTMSYGSQDEKATNKVTTTYASQGQKDPRKATLSYGSQGEEAIKKVTTAYDHQGQKDPRKATVSYGSQGEKALKKVATSHASQDQKNPRKVTISYGSQGEKALKKVTKSHVSQSVDSRKVATDEEALNKVTMSYGSHCEDSRKVTTSYGSQGEEHLRDVITPHRSQGEHLREVSTSYGSQGEEDLREVSTSYGSQGQENLREVSMSYDFQGKDGLREVSTSYGPPGKDDLKEVSTSYGSRGEKNLRDVSRTSYVSRDQENLREVSTSYGSQGDDGLREVSTSYGSQGGRRHDGHPHMHSHNEGNKLLADVFFFRDVLRPGSVITPTIPATTSLPPLLPRHEADSLPFSTERFADIVAMLAPASLGMAAEMRWTLDTCEHPRPLPGERAGCATSLEALAQLPATLLGTRNLRAFSGDMPIDPAGSPAQRGRYNVTAVAKLSESPAAATCHDLTYPYAVFYCHTTNPAATYMVTLVAQDGRAPAMKALAVCHLDTSLWSPRQPFLVAHNLKPGDVAVCHFLSKLSIIWVPAGEQQGGGRDTR